MSGHEEVPEIQLSNGSLDNWVYAPIGDLCDLHNGRAFKPTEWADEGLPIVRIQNLNDPKRPYNYFPGTYDSRHYLKGGELLFAWSGTPGTSFGAHIWTGGEALVNQHIFRVDFDETKLDKRFLRYAINQKLNDLIDVAHGGVGLRHITKGKFEATPVALPPLAEQVRIAGKLDVLLVHVTSGRERLERVTNLLKRFRQSVLSAAVSGELTREWREANPHEQGGASQSEVVIRGRLWGSGIVPELTEEETENIPQGWSWAKLGALGLGTTPAVQIGPMSMKSNQFAEHGLPVLNVGTVQTGYFDHKKLNYLPQHLTQPFGRYLIRSGDILFTRSGTIGRCAVATAKEDGFLMTFHLLRIRVNQGVCLTSYALFALQGGKTIIRQIEESAIGATRAGFNTGLLEGLDIPLPPLIEQAEIVRRVEALFAIADRIEARYQSALTTFNHLTPALLTKAFRGELVPQDPNDEPGSVLLERIRATQALKAAKPKQHRKASGTIGAGGTGKRGRPRKNSAATQDGLFTDIGEAASLEEAIARLEAQKVQKRLLTVQQILQAAIQQGRRMALSDLHRNYRSAFPDDDVSNFYTILKQLPPRTIEEAVQQDILWETVSAD